MIAFFVAMAAYAEDPPTAYAPAGVPVVPTVDSFVVPRERLEKLMALAQVGAAAPAAEDACREAVAALQPCAEASQVSATQLSAAILDIGTLERRLHAAQVQRNIAVIGSGITGVVIASVLVGVVIGG